MGLKDANRFARLHQQRLIFFQLFEAGNNLIEIFPSACRTADPAIHNQLMGVFGHVWMQIVHQHSHWGLGQPAFGGQIGPCGGKNITRILAGIVHGRPLGVGAGLAQLGLVGEI